MTRIWQQFGQGKPGGAELAGLLADGLGGLAGFVLLAAGDDGQWRLFCRGSLGATVHSGAQADEVAGAGLLTWREQVIAPPAERIVLGGLLTDTALRLPAASGVLLAGCVTVDLTDDGARNDVPFDAPGLFDRAGPAGGHGEAKHDDAAAAQVWHLVAEARQAATAGLPLHRRAWVRLNPASLLTARGTAPPRGRGRPRALTGRRRGVAGWPGEEGAPALRPAAQPVRVAE